MAQINFSQRLVITTDCANHCGESVTVVFNGPDTVDTDTLRVFCEECQR